MNALAWPWVSPAHKNALYFKSLIVIMFNMT